jgi:hypothetical protein
MGTSAATHGMMSLPEEGRRVLVRVTNIDDNKNRDRTGAGSSEKRKE